MSRMASCCHWPTSVYMSPRRQRRDRLAGAAVDAARKDDAGHELHAGPVGLDEERGPELLDQRGAADALSQIDERAAANGSDGNARWPGRAGLAIVAVVCQLADAAIGLFETPGRLRPFEGIAELGSRRIDREQKEPAERNSASGTEREGNGTALVLAPTL